MSSVRKCDHLIELEIQSVELRSGVSLYFLPSKIGLLCLSQVSFVEVFQKCLHSAEV